MVEMPLTRSLGSGEIRLRDMGSFFFSGRIVRQEDGDTFHGDHGYAQYFIPEGTRDLPIIMWHGLGQSGKSWESTPDGRDGFWQIFCKRQFSTVLIDQPRRGRAGRAIIDPAEGDPPIPNLESEAATWSTFRLGQWLPPEPAGFYEHLNFPTDAESIEQFFRQQTPNTGAEPFPSADTREFLANAVGDLLRRVGPSILMTHSHSGQYGWTTGMRHPETVRAIVALEPGEFSFPDDAVPGEIETTSEILPGFMAPQVVPAEEFEALTRIPLLLIMGDNIMDDPKDEWGEELWRMCRIRARQFVEVVNARGGDATLVELGDTGTRGNTHFPQMDFNNVDVADLICGWLAEHKLDLTT